MFDDASAKLIASATFGGKSGARGVRAYIRRHVEDPLAELLIAQGEESVTGVSLSVTPDGKELALATI